MNNEFTLRELRARKNKTQAEVAKDLNISAQTYNVWENNPEKIKLGEALKLAKYFDVTIRMIKVF